MGCEMIKIIWGREDTWDEAWTAISVGLEIRAGRDLWSYDADSTLVARSALELVRDQLSKAEIAELNKVDAVWKDTPKQFNAFFSNEHACHDRTTELDGWLVDTETKAPPPIPKDHWWWWPIQDGPKR